jgi:hypothetical protein
MITTPRRISAIAKNFIHIEIATAIGLTPFGTDALLRLLPFPQLLRKLLTFLRFAVPDANLCALLIIDWSQVQVLVGPPYSKLLIPHKPCILSGYDHP